MSKPIHVDGNLHKAVKKVATDREVPMKNIVEELLREDSEIAEEEERIQEKKNNQETEPVEA